MQPTAQHLHVEEGFRRLLEENELPAPGRVEYEPGTVWFFWDDRKVATAVDFADGADIEHVGFVAAEAA